MTRSPRNLTRIIAELAELTARVTALEAARARPTVAKRNRERAMERENLIRGAIGAVPLNYRGLAGEIARRIERNPERYGFKDRLPSERAIRAVIEKMLNEKTVIPLMDEQHAPYQSGSVTIGST